MTRPTRFLLTMGLFLLVIVVGVGVTYSRLIDAFLANSFLNGVILATLFIGIVHAFRTVATLNKEITWIDSFRNTNPGAPRPSGQPPRLMASAATLLSERSSRSGELHISTTAMQTLLDGVATRMDEARETTRYMVGLLVFLGLLGTFWGLMQTINSVGDVISNLQIGGDGGDVTEGFAALKQGLQAPLSGMGTAFSSSLFGLAGSLILGFLALQSGQAQNQFYQNFEDWLSSLTRLTGGSSFGEGDQPVPAYIQALLEQTADSLERLQRTMARSEEGRLTEQDSLNALTQKLSALADSMRVEQDLMLKLAESQQDLKSTLIRLAENQTSGGIDDQTRNHLRNMDTYLGRLVTDLPRGRNESVQEIRSEIRLLARTIAALAEGGEA